MYDKSTNRWQAHAVPLLDIIRALSGCFALDSLSNASSSSCNQRHLTNRVETSSRTSPTPCFIPHRTSSKDKTWVRSSAIMHAGTATIPSVLAGPWLKVVES